MICSSGYKTRLLITISSRQHLFHCEVRQPSSAVVDAFAGQHQTVVNSQPRLLCFVFVCLLLCFVCCFFLSPISAWVLGDKFYVLKNIANFGSFVVDCSLTWDSSCQLFIFYFSNLFWRRLSTDCYRLSPCERNCDPGV